MENDAAELLRRALSLPEEARAAFADSLWASLDHEVDRDGTRKFGAGFRKSTVVQSSPYLGGTSVKSFWTAWSGDAASSIPSRRKSGGQGSVRVVPRKKPLLAETLAPGVMWTF